MNYYKATIQYDGTGYAGFQWQKGLKTIQSDFNFALEKIIGSDFTTSGASRTDSGVHALEQVLKITTSREIDCSQFKELINLHLPDKIKCNNFEMSFKEFHPSAHCVSKEYRYFFTNHIQSITDNQVFISNISRPLNTIAMQTALEALLGQHDFCNFQSAGSNVKSSIREIKLVELVEINPHHLFVDHPLFVMPDKTTNCFQLRIIANGFLKQMIRHIVSGLWRVGTGKLSVEQFKSLIDAPKSSKQLWKVAPANGLFLYKIQYTP